MDINLCLAGLAERDFARSRTASVETDTLLCREKSRKRLRERFIGGAAVADSILLLNTTSKCG